MTYTPLWEQDAAKSREAIALTAHFPEHVRSALTHVATTLGERLRGDFPDVDPTLVGWVAVRISHFLNGAIRQAPQLNTENLVMITLLTGHHLTDGGAR